MKVLGNLKMKGVVKWLIKMLPRDQKNNYLVNDDYVEVKIFKKQKKQSILWWFDT